MNEETWNNWEQYESPALQRAAQRWGEAAVVQGAQVEQQASPQQTVEQNTWHNIQEKERQDKELQERAQRVQQNVTGYSYEYSDPAAMERKIVNGIEVTGRHIEGMRLFAVNQELGASYSELIRQDNNETMDKAA